MDHKEKTVFNNPLFYIEQPTIQFPKEQMQSHYSFSIEEKVKEIKEETTNTKRGRRKSTQVEAEQDLEQTTDLFSVPKEEQDVQSSVSAADYFRSHLSKQTKDIGLHPVKPFPQMTVDEKLHYLNNRIQFYYCTFFTRDKRVIGKLNHLSENSVIIETVDKEYITLRKEEITEIKLNG